MARCSVQDYLSLRKLIDWIHGAYPSISCAAPLTEVNCPCPSLRLFNTVGLMTSCTTAELMGCLLNSVVELDKTTTRRGALANQTVAIDDTHAAALDQAKTQLEQSVRCLWYEFTPYEIGCDELGGQDFRQMTPGVC